MASIPITPPAQVRSSLPDLFFTDEMPRQWPAIFMYAIAGAGKTNTLRTLKHLNPLVLATEDGQTKGMSTLQDLKIAAILIDELDQLVAVTTELSARAKPNELYYRSPASGVLHGPFGCLALDSCTGIGPMLEAASCKIKGWAMIWDKGKGEAQPRTAYPYINEKGRQVIRKLMTLPVPLVMTCREQMVTEGEGDKAKSYPAPELPGQKLPRELPGWPEATLRLRVINGVRQFITETEGDVVARVRLGEGHRLPKYIKPDLGALIRVLQKDYSAMEELKLDAPVAAKLTPQQQAAEDRRKAEAIAKQTPPVQNA